MTGSRSFRALLFAGLTLALCFLTVPVVAIFVDAGPGDLLNALDDSSSTDALRLSLETTSIAMAIVVAVGTPAAYALATRRFRGKALVTTLLELPIVLPPAAAGIGLLAALGPKGLFGAALDGAGIHLV
ncbi:MAG: molybdate transporter, inner rane subunit, partial [Solirubrobacterales bacterium]|nr:molybdate transporter, inner rane subunit [Solirubrobacterales bacterium]